ncbi:glycosyltransferase [Pasteurella caecimuris]|uniref:glycosyltransferase family 2 protein n=1 Tax=Rodentibacter caecimuris TaxID=1796644 RepID=UPI00214F988D|nr:glycosyltransferase [Pasteurella caecimuris]MCR1837560.1 glycosyltransferase [Pasteurella caecimuris]MCU0107115.1 glycosyltransferase [Pasteurella caecimuris]
MISLLIISFGRYQEVLETFQCINKYQGNQVELLFLDNNSERKLETALSSIIESNSSILFKYFHTGENLGVAEGRNLLIEKAQGDILITLDDDIEIEDITFLIKKVIDYMENNILLGALAFNIKNYFTRNALSHEIPHGNKKLDFSQNLLTYYFIGAGHAIRKDVYQKAGLYPKDLGLYGGEERDLSFRILEEGYQILYASDIVIYHKVSPNGRMSKTQENFFRYRNQLIVLNRYMPRTYRYSANIIWSLFYLLRMEGNLKSVIKVHYELRKLGKYTISNTTLNYIKNVKGRLLY